MEPRVSAVEEDIEDMGTDEEEELMEVEKKNETEITASILKQDPNKKFNHLSILALLLLWCYFS